MGANLGYRINITSNGGAKEISLETKANQDKEFITSVKFKNGLVDGENKTKATATRNLVEIKGYIREENKECITQFADWSIDTNSKTEYRDVEISINSGADFNGNNLRSFELKNMFVLSYDEDYINNDENDNGGVYTLVIAPKNVADEINIFDS